MSKSLAEWIKFYEDKTGEKFVRDKNYELFYLPDKGFCEIAASDKMIVGKQMAGDGRFWKNFVEQIAFKLGKEICGTWCVRKAIKAWIRFFGFKIESIENLSDGFKRYHCKNKYGKWGLMSPAYDKDGGEQKYYFVTWEV